MRVFVPRRHFNAAPDDKVVMGWTYTEVDHTDLPRIVQNWRELEHPAPDSHPSEYFWRRAKDVCEHPTSTGTLIEFMLRPHITIHAGAKDGKPAFTQRLHDAAYKAGRLAAVHGFSVWNGGGGCGPMGATIQGFKDGIQENGGALPGQYSVQVIPADFAFPPLQDAGSTSITIANEGLSLVTDATIITTDFTTRRELLNGLCVAAISCPGGTGTLDEATCVGVHRKTGLRKTHLYIINAPFPELGGGFYDPFKKQIETSIAAGAESASSLDYFQFVETPQLALEDLMQKLTESQQTPDKIFQENCRIFDIDPDAFKNRIQFPERPPEKAVTPEQPQANCG